MIRAPSSGSGAPLRTREAIQAAIRLQWRISSLRCNESHTVSAVVCAALPCWTDVRRSHAGRIHEWKSVLSTAQRPQRRVLLKPGAQSSSASAEWSLEFSSSAQARTAGAGGGSAEDGGPRGERGEKRSLKRTQ
ncbi:hypothetical protein AOLI_G00042170 [Acnodon oligacanthus]